MYSLIAYGLVALSIFSAGFGSAWYWQGLRWDADKAAALAAQREAAETAHRLEIEAKDKLLADKQREIEVIKKSLATQLRLLAEAKARAEALHAEYETLKAQSAEVRGWAGTPIPGDVCRVLDGVDCAGGGEDRPAGEVRPAAYAAPRPAGTEV